MERKNGKKAARCRVIQELPDDMSDEDIIRAIKAITGAPVDISDSDEKQLNDLNKIK